MSQTFDLDKLLEEDSKKYQSKELKEHILELPDTYIGSIEPSPLENAWIANEEGELEQKTIQATMGLYKIFDEILTNSSDNVVRTRTTKDSEITKTIKVNLNEDNSISVYNDGEGIPVVEHLDHKVLIPELIFGKLLTSGNYVKGEKRRVGGKNGYGSKICSIFSTSFEVETIDHRRKKKFYQRWEDNMSEPKQKAKVTSFSGKPYTKITFLPDFERFGVKGLSEEMISLFRKRVIDIAGISPADVSVFLNDKKIPIKNFEQYANLYIGDKKENKRVAESQEFWDVIACASPDGNHRQVSFVNGVCTIEGGKHCDYIANQICKKLCDYVNNKGKKNKDKKSDKDIQTKHVKSNLWIFVNCSIENPAFSSQTKVNLTTPITKFGSKCELSEDFIKKLEKTEIVERARMLKGFHDKAGMSKTDGKKTKSIRGIPKLDDANWAGTNKSAECTLILTEGDSAKTFAIHGLTVLGRDKYGVFPLRGKLLNVRDATDKQITGNAEIENLKKIIGLQQGKKYANLSELRYGKILVLTDQDLDGSHIKGLIINMIDYFWPELQEMGFVVSMYTPIVKVFKDKAHKQVLNTFYTLQAYNDWKERNTSKTFFVKYYKGLGTSVREEAIEYFKKLKIYEFVTSDTAREKVDMAFNKKRADNRKTWLKTYVEHNILDSDEKKVSINEFVDKDLIHFSNYDNIRSIPSMCDGLKPSQRKALFGMNKLNVRSEQKVSSVTGSIASITSYHHGEASMSGTITGMAFDFVGSNNISLFCPAGNFGTRLQGGKDCASVRYIFTYLQKITDLIFRKEDEPLLEFLDDDGKTIEPKWYMPIIPMILVNGSHGIGTGFSTHVPCFNPKDVIAGLQRMLEGKKANDLKPWYRGFKGKIVSKNGKWFSEGLFSIERGNKILITELPVGVWTEDYYEHLEKMTINSSETDKKKKDAQCLVSYVKENGNDAMSVRLSLSFKREHYEKYENDSKKFKKDFKLEESKSCSVTNLHLFDPLGQMVKFKTVDGILRSFYRIRLPFYAKRREYFLKFLDMEVRHLSEKIRFIEGIIQDKINIDNKPDKEVVFELRDKHEFEPDPLKENIQISPIPASVYKKALEGEIFNPEENSDISSADSDEETDSDSSDSDSSDSDSDSDFEEEFMEELERKVEKKLKKTSETRDDDKIITEDYGYLVSMQIRTLTQKKADMLRKEYEKKKEELERMKKITSKDIWRNELKELESVLEKES